MEKRARQWCPLRAGHKLRKVAKFRRQSPIVEAASKQLAKNGPLQNDDVPIPTLCDIHVCVPSAGMQCKIALGPHAGSPAASGRFAREGREGTARRLHTVLGPLTNHNRLVCVMPSVPPLLRAYVSARCRWPSAMAWRIAIAWVSDLAAYL
jgi:hypothetical protein